MLSRGQGGRRVRKGSWIWCLGFIYDFKTLVAAEAGLYTVRLCGCGSS